jgi:hypothetical protein
MPRLSHINLHNDGHVTDDGLPALRALRCLTSLDLQGSISITNRWVYMARQWLLMQCQVQSHSASGWARAASLL